MRREVEPIAICVRPILPSGPNPAIGIGQADATGRTKKDMSAARHLKVTPRVAARALTGLIVTFAILPICAQAEEIRIGKYFCYVSHMAGIQQKEDGQIASGNFKPTKEKFFIDIHPAAHPSQDCGPSYPESFSDWFVCKANFEIQIDNDLRLRGDTVISFIGPFPFGEQFVLYPDGTFNQHQTILDSGGWFVSDGKCTRI
jgi:hypothetical protein